MWMGAFFVIKGSLGLSLLPSQLLIPTHAKKEKISFVTMAAAKDRILSGIDKGPYTRGIYCGFVDFLVHCDDDISYIGS